MKMFSGPAAFFPHCLVDSHFFSSPTKPKTRVPAKAKMSPSAEHTQLEEESANKTPLRREGAPFSAKKQHDTLYNSALSLYFSGRIDNTSLLSLFNLQDHQDIRIQISMQMLFPLLPFHICSIVLAPAADCYPRNLIFFSREPFPTHHSKPDE